MVYVLKCYSEIGAHVSSEIGYLICLRHFFLDIESSHKSEFFYSKNLLFCYTCATCYDLPSNISTMIYTKIYLLGFSLGLPNLKMNIVPYLFCSKFL